MSFVQMRGVVLCAVLATAGCGHMVAMTPDVVRQEGRIVVAVERERALKAVEEALDALNIGVALSKPEIGLVVSKRFTLAAYATRGRYVASVNEDTIQYDVTVRPAGDGAKEMEIVVSPRGFHNGVEVTAREVWQLDGAQGQRARWQQLFGEIRRMLGV